MSSVRRVQLLIVTLLSCALPTTRVDAQGAGVTLRGQVYDSVGARALDGARVVLLPSQRETLSDRNGRFAFDALPSGAHRVIVQHDALDSLGLFSLTRDLVADGRSEAVISTPSFATFYRRLCGQDPSPASTLVFGQLMPDSATSAPPDTAVRDTAARDTLAAEWFELLSSGSSLSDVRQRRWQLSVDVATDGAFAVCGATADASLRLSAAGRTPSARWVVDTTLDVAPHRVRHATIIRAWQAIAAEDAAVEPAVVEQARVAGTPVAGTPVASAPVGVLAESGVGIRGRVRRADGSPVPGAIVEAASLETRSDSTGRFRLPAVPDTGTVRITALGFKPYVMDLAPLAASNAELLVTLEPVTALDRVDVTATRISRIAAGYNERRRMGFGDFRDSTDMEKSPSLNSVLRTMPSVVVPPAGRSMEGLRLSTECYRTEMIDIRLDGHPTTLDDLAALDMRTVAALEVYRRRSALPSELMASKRLPCAIWVWTKFKIAP